ncbi:MAG: hypothetical protein IKY70_07795 [Bacteroidales bacterium]|nr:hypothetical protein [Bacteroidales bacterium]
MKKAISYLFSILFVGIYILSTMGYGVHKCAVEGTNDVIIMFGTTPCEYAHANRGLLKGCFCATVHDESNGSEDMQHDGGCCSTETHSVSTDQINSSNDVDQTPFFDFAYAVYDCNLQGVLSDCSSFNGVVYSTGFKMPLTSGIHIKNSQLRV